MFGSAQPVEVVKGPKPNLNFVSPLCRALSSDRQSGDTKFIGGIVCTVLASPDRFATDEHHVPTPVIR